MNSLVECVPNFSEGRKVETVERLVEVIESVHGAVVLDTHMDADHNRSVITFVASPDAVLEASFRAVELASDLIDLRRHSGQHPRIGATDVLPFVPVSGVSMEDCVDLAHAAGERIATELGIPVYFYGHAARRQDRVNLEDVRRDGFEPLREAIATIQDRAPDLGEPAVHQSAGAIAIGARPILIAYNINLRTDDSSIARGIARQVRGRDGGLRYLKALGFKLSSRGFVQVSMNLVNYEKTSLHHAFDAVRREAERYGVAIVGSEIVGLVPQAALDRAAEYYLRIEKFETAMVLEHRIEASFQRKSEEARADTFVARVASPSPASGGGAAAAHAASLGAALGEMIGHLTERTDKYTDVQQEIVEAIAQLSALRSSLDHAVVDDAAAFKRVIEARRKSVSRNDDDLGGPGAVESALKGATIVPIEIATLSLQVLELLETLAEIGNPKALADAASGAQLSLAAISGARYNVLVNTAEIEDEEFAAEHRSRVDDLLGRAREIASRVEALFMDSIQQ